MNHHSDLKMKFYYKTRAPIYDRIYFYPERQSDLRFLEAYIPKHLTDLDVLEIAAGTGYWSQFIHSKAKSLLATDASPETLEYINTRPLAHPIPTMVADAYSLTGVQKQYNGAFAGHWISHIPNQRLDEFLTSMHRCLNQGAKVIFMDNTLTQIDRIPLSHSDKEGNTYQERKLDDGSIHSVLKNFPTEQELIKITSPFGVNHKYQKLKHFWLFQYNAK